MYLLRLKRRYKRATTFRNLSSYGSCLFNQKLVILSCSIKFSIYTYTYFFQPLHQHLSRVAPSDRHRQPSRRGPLHERHEALWKFKFSLKVNNYYYIIEQIYIFYQKNVASFLQLFFLGFLFLLNISFRPSM